MGFVWDLCGVPMVFVKGLYLGPCRICKGFSWVTMGSLRDLLGGPMGFARDLHGV